MAIACGLLPPVGKKHDGVGDAWPESAFYMVGTIDEAIEKAKKIQ